MMSEPWSHGQFVKVVKFPDYVGGDKPNVDGINFMIYKDLQTAFLDFKAGSLDWTQIPNGQFKATAAQYGKHNTRSDNPMYLRAVRRDGSSGSRYILKGCHAVETTTWPATPRTDPI